VQCPACKSISPDDVRFCLHCGHYLGEPEEVTRVISPPPRAQTTIRAPEWIPVTLSGDDERKNKKLSGLQVAGIVLVAVLVLCAGIVIGVAIIADNEPTKSSRVASSATPTPIVINSVPAFAPTPTPTIESKTLLLGPSQALEIEPAHFKVISFSVASVRGAEVVGWFRSDATAIDARILNEHDYIDFIRANTSNYTYDSGSIRQGKINVLLERGSYHLVFNNNAAETTTVSGNIVLTPQN
jgi:hypothetical protein